MESNDSVGEEHGCDESFASQRKEREMNRTRRPTCGDSDDSRARSRRAFLKSSVAAPLAAGLAAAEPAAAQAPESAPSPARRNVFVKQRGGNDLNPGTSGC